MKQKIAMIAPVLLLGATVTSGGKITLESADVAGVGGGLLNAVGSLLDMLFQFAPYIAGFAIAMIAFGMIKKYAQLRMK